MEFKVNKGKEYLEVDKDIIKDISIVIQRGKEKVKYNVVNLNSDDVTLENENDANDVEILAITESISFDTLNGVPTKVDDFMYEIENAFETQNVVEHKTFKRCQ